MILGGKPTIFFETSISWFWQKIGPNGIIYFTKPVFFEIMGFPFQNSQPFWGEVLWGRKLICTKSIQKKWSKPSETYARSTKLDFISLKPRKKWDWELVQKPKLQSMEIPNPIHENGFLKIHGKSSWWQVKLESLFQPSGWKEKTSETTTFVG